MGGTKVISGRKCTFGGSRRGGLECLLPSLPRVSAVLLRDARSRDLTLAPLLPHKMVVVYVFFDDLFVGENCFHEILVLIVLMMVKLPRHIAVKALF